MKVGNNIQSSSGSYFKPQTFQQLLGLCDSARKIPPRCQLELEKLAPPSTMISGGGTHCRVSIVRGSEGNDYISKDYGSKVQQLRSSLDMAASVGWDLVIPFIHTDSTKVLQELNSPVDEVVRMTLRGKPTDAQVAQVEECIRQFFRVNIALIERGVFNWDPKLENFCLDSEGRMRLCDIAGLTSTQSVVEQINNEHESLDDYIPYSLLKLNERVPEEAMSIFNSIRDETCFRHGGTLAHFVLSFTKGKERTGA